MKKNPKHCAHHCSEAASKQLIFFIYRCKHDWHQAQLILLAESWSGFYQFLEDGYIPVSLYLLGFMVYLSPGSILIVQCDGAEFFSPFYLFLWKQSNMWGSPWAWIDLMARRLQLILSEFTPLSCSPLWLSVFPSKLHHDRSTFIHLCQKLCWLLSSQT